MDVPLSLKEVLRHLKEERIQSSNPKKSYWQSECDGILHDAVGSKSNLVLVSREVKAAYFQLLQDVVDIIIPAGNLRWLPVDEGIIGIAGYDNNNRDVLKETARC